MQVYRPTCRNGSSKKMLEFQYKVYLYIVFASNFNKLPTYRYIFTSAFLLAR